MTLKTWLSTSNISSQKQKMTAGISILPPNGNLRESPTQGCALPTVTCGRMKPKRSKNWKAKSVEDGLESVEQSDYGFLEYFSLRQYNPREIITDTSSHLGSSHHGSWNPYENSWNHAKDWNSFSSAQFYPGTLNRQDAATKKRNRRNRPQSLLQENHQRKYHFQSDHLRTSTPLTNPPLCADLNRYNLEKCRNKNKNSSSSILKRNSVLSKLRPDKWMGLEGTLQRSRSRDDGLNTSKNAGVTASQPDILASHVTSTTTNSSPNPVISPPAPLSILPPTCRNAEANVSTTLPRRRRTSDNKENTLFARGKRWLTGGSSTAPTKDDSLKMNRINVSSVVNSNCTPPREEEVKLDNKKPYKECIQYDQNRNECRIDKIQNSGGVRVSPEKHPLERLPTEKHPLERLRCRKPLSFYLLEDYLSPVKASSGVELDEYLNKTPRVLFNECPQRPLPPTPGWDTPSLSPPHSLVSGLSCHRDTAALSPSTDGSLNLIDTPPDSEKADQGGCYSPSSSSSRRERDPPYFSPSHLAEKRKSWQTSLFLPTQNAHSPPSIKSYSSSKVGNANNLRRNSQNLESRSSTQSSFHYPSYSHSFNYSSLSNNYFRPYASSTLRSMENLHSSSSSFTLDSGYSSRTLLNYPKRTNSNAKDRKRSRNSEIRYNKVRKSYT